MRTIVLGNRSLYLGFDQALSLREMFWPVVGLSNHVGEERETGFLLWYKGQVFRIGGENWEAKAWYGKGMVSQWKLCHPRLPFSIEVKDAVDPILPLWQRRLRLFRDFSSDNWPKDSDQADDIGIYAKHYYNLGENTIGEGAFWDDQKARLYHYKGPFWVGVALCLNQVDDRERLKNLTSSEITSQVAMGAYLGASYGRVAKRRDGGTRIAWDTGEIQGQAVDHGLIDSILGFRANMRRSLLATYSLSLGSSRKEVDQVLDKVGMAEDSAKKGNTSQDPPLEQVSHIESLAERRSQRWWDFWCRHTRNEEILESLTDLRRNLYGTSLKVLFTHVDRGGGVLASLDQDIMGDYRDHYRYVWPRDAAMCVSAFCRAGYPQPAKEYLSFCQKAMTESGFFWQRYRPDATRGSGWHPYTLPAGELPIQEDETALSLVTAGHYLNATGDLDYLSSIYPHFILKAARFIMDYTTDGGALVKPSFDLWEERRGTFAYTQAACVAALYSAREIAWALGEKEAQDFLEAGLFLHKGLLDRLSSDQVGFFRGKSVWGEYDDTPDASLLMIPVLLSDFSDALQTEPIEAGSATKARKKANWGLADIGEKKRCELSRVFGITLSRSFSTWKRVGEGLRVHFPEKSVFGIARYPGDWYMRSYEDHHIPGNPWFVTTSWYLQAYLTLSRLEKSLWDGQAFYQGERFFYEFSLPTGVLSEQVNGLTREPISCAPLAWSHASYIDLIHSWQECGKTPMGQ